MQRSSPGIVAVSGSRLENQSRLSGFQASSLTRSRPTWSTCVLEARRFLRPEGRDRYPRGLLGLRRALRSRSGQDQQLHSLPPLVHRAPTSGYGVVAAHQFSKLATGVRFSLSAQSPRAVKAVRDRSGPQRTGVLKGWSRRRTIRPDLCC